MPPGPPPLPAAYAPAETPPPPPLAAQCTCICGGPVAVVRVRVAKVLVVPPQVFRACREVMLRPDMAELVGQYSWGQNRCRSTVDKFASDSQCAGREPGSKSSFLYSKRQKYITLLYSIGGIAISVFDFFCFFSPCKMTRVPAGAVLDEMTVVPRMKRIRRSLACSSCCKKSVLLNLDTLQSCFSQSLKNAAKYLGICATVLKRYYTSHEILGT